MANPQPDEFTKVSTEVLDALCRFRIPGECRQVFDSIIRKTWGWKKLSDDISLGQFVELTGLKRSNVVRSLKLLESMKLITVKRDNRVVSKGILLLTTNYCIQNDYDKWIEAKVVSEVIPGSIKTPHKGSIKKALKVVSEVIPTIDTTIDTIQKISCNEVNPDDFFKDDPILKPVSDLAKAMQYFYDSFERKTSQKYLANFAKETVIFKEILKVLNVDQTKKMIDRFFATEDDFIIKSGFTIGVFKTQINKLQTNGDKYGNIDPALRKYIRDPKSR